MASWLCPFCNHLSTKETVATRTSGHDIPNTTHGSSHVEITNYTCPNPDCKEVQVEAALFRKYFEEPRYQYQLLNFWTLRPQGKAKIFPDYIPQAILNDYKEACLIQELSPKASATLSRRCLQGMIRDFWKVEKKNLFEEIKAIEEKVDADTWQAIDAIRSIGNIGAHMEKDIDVIIDVDSDEAGLLISLIETLLNDWYVERESRRLRSQKIIEAAAEKKQLKQNK
ncbi:DUF4145 domain-containing protein [Raoultella ornithinolytica]|uniref:DUF4145 domain-containing protein n=1 Tax=Raoultella ornithinolytica TaxID=54291 RepID=UPI0022475F7C|nr:DUF4145 domain-containing protein [Raoultella ornithinolytica]MCW9581286.1 DUF4145 domain-containing protein [Raoultella ornithinolytica]